MATTTLTIIGKVERIVLEGVNGVSDGCCLLCFVDSPSRMIIVARPGCW